MAANLKNELLHESFDSNSCSPLSIRNIKCENERQRIFEFRHQVLAEQMGREIFYSNAERQINTDLMDSNAVILGAYFGDEIVGTARLNFSSTTRFVDADRYGISEYERLHPGQSSLISKLMTASHYRGPHLFLGLTRKLFIEAAAKNIQHIFLATADHLVPLFQKLGFVAHSPRIESYGVFGALNPMMLSLRKTQHLKHVGSPLSDLSEKLNAMDVLELRSELHLSS